MSCARFWADNEGVSLSKPIQKAIAIAIANSVRQDSHDALATILRILLPLSLPPLPVTTFSVILIPYVPSPHSYSSPWFFLPLDKQSPL